MKRIFLFLLTNLAVLAVLSIVARLTGLDAWLAVHGQSLGGLLVFAAFIGFGGAFISLALSKWTAKRAMGVQVIDPSTTDPTAQWLLSVVAQHARSVGVDMPEVGIFESPAPNAFATGANRNKALVAVSTGLLRSMQRPQVEAVLGHEMTHVANGDMVTLTLVQGVVNTFVIFLSRLIAGIISRSEDGRGGAYFLTYMVLQLVFGVLANMIVSTRTQFGERGSSQNCMSWS
jgi:heat shock protein HtpX